MRAVVAVVLLMLTACVSRPVGNVVQSGATTTPPVKILPGQKGTVAVRTGVPDAERYVRDIDYAIRTKLEERGVFAGMTVDPAYADILVDVAVTEVKGVSPGARAMVGAMAGKASVSAVVRIIDRKSGAVLDDMNAVGVSSAGTVFSGYTQEAFDALAMRIADYLLANRKS